MQNNPTPRLFLLLKLPFIALIHFLSNLNLEDIISFSLISKKTRFFIKPVASKNKIDLHAICVDDIILLLFWKNYFYELRKPKMQENSSYIFRAHTFIRNNLTGLNLEQIWIEYICELFGCDVTTLDVYPNHFGRLCQISNWLNSRQSSIQDCKVDGHIVNPEILSSFLHTLKITRNLTLSFNHDYEITPVHFPILKMDYFWVRAARDINWIPIESILTSDCVHIDLGYLTFEETDMNRFLKGWINGSNKRLKSFSTWLDEMNHQLLIDGIEVEERDTSVKRIYDRKQLHQEGILFDGGYDVRYNNSELATFQQSDRLFRMVVWGR